MGDAARTPNGVALPLPNPALYTTEDHRIYSAPSPPLNLGPEDCVVHVRANGICGSDIHFWKVGEIGTCIVNSDYVLGHEGAGVVVFAGSNVKHLVPGDRVAIEPGMPCHECYNCTTGDYNLCPTVEFSGAPPINGSIRRYHSHHSKYLHKIPDSLSFSDGALLEPLSVVLHAFERAPLRLGQPALICGAGPIGLIALAAAKANGAWPLVITDIDTTRLEFAKKFVPECEVYLTSMAASPEDIAAEIILLFEETLRSEQPSIVYECSGVHNSVHTAAYACRRGGQVMVIGVGKAIMDGLPFMHLSLAEIDLKFINRYHHSWPYAIRLLSSGYIDLKPLITHTFALEEAVRALETAADRTQRAIKIHILDPEPSTSN
ncbi:hypothetical protein VTL71DRAFT_9967 [Oculimacula yallundae]|uniref:Enoyl reductase (ER) domain-containing protein n=1 Tax=Oculimacula yallundae TaxID=86028 RepID=A0ABR4BR44_9HELO